MTLTQKERIIALYRRLGIDVPAIIDVETWPLPILEAIAASEEEKKS